MNFDNQLENQLRNYLVIQEVISNQKAGNYYSISKKSGDSIYR